DAQRRPAGSAREEPVALTWTVVGAGEQPPLTPALTYLHPAAAPMHGQENPNSASVVVARTPGPLYWVHLLQVCCQRAQLPRVTIELMLTRSTGLMSSRIQWGCPGALSSQWALTSTIELMLSTPCTVGSQSGIICGACRPTNPAPATNVWPWALT